ncbi:MAG: hypothetical protein ACXU8A_05595 [Burkholderiaceae bacterium]
MSAKNSKDLQGKVILALRFNVASNWEAEGSTRRVRYKADESILNIQPSEFVAYGSTSRIPLKITLQNIREVVRGNGSEYPLPPIIQLRASTPSHGDTWFILYFEIELNGENQFSLIVPKLTIDGKTSIGRKIHFVEKTGTWVEPLNC